MRRLLAAITIGLLALVVVAMVPAGAIGGLDSPPQSEPMQRSQQADGNTSNASFGASVSGFMQASAADAEGDVEDGMFRARFEATGTERRGALVQQRTDQLDTKLARLRAERERLLDDTDGAPTVAERAKAARLAARIEALEESITTASSAADRAGVDAGRLERLRESVNDLSGPEIAELARGLAGVGINDRGEMPGPDTRADPAQKDGNSTDTGGNKSTVPDGSSSGVDQEGSTGGVDYTASRQ